MRRKVEPCSVFQLSIEVRYEGAAGAAYYIRPTFYKLETLYILG